MRSRISVPAGEIKVENGAVLTTNFHNYPIIRMSQAPKIDVIIMPSTESPTGIGEPGEALTAIAPERAGQVATHGEIWNATSGEPIPKGTRVRVTGVDRLTLVVRRD